MLVPLFADYTLLVHAKTGPWSHLLLNKTDTDVQVVLCPTLINTRIKHVLEH